MKMPLFAIAVISLITQAAPPRDSTAARSNASGVIRGRILSATTGQPLHRVRVTLNAQLPNPPSAVTDTRGDYEITGLPAGSYTLTAARSGYLTLQYGQRRPAEAGRIIELKDGQTVDRIDMALVRGGVLGGVIVDDVGELYPGVRVEALEFRYLRGRRLLVQAASATTNDLGQYRIGGLSPGSYIVKASSTDTWESDDGAATHAYAVTYFPGTTSMDQAERVTLAIGQDLRNFNFAMRQGRAATITGLMQTAAGEPVAAQVINASRAIRGVGDALFATGGPGGGRARTDQSGAFQISGLAPGEYVVSAGDDASGVSVTVSDGDSKHVILSARKPGVASGIVTTDEGTPPPFQPNRLRVIPVNADRTRFCRSSLQQVRRQSGAIGRFD